jgi:hypothetical protein
MSRIQINDIQGLYERLGVDPQSYQAFEPPGLRPAPVKAPIASPKSTESCETEALSPTPLESLFSRLQGLPAAPVPQPAEGAPGQTPLEALFDRLVRAPLSKGKAT